MNDDQPDDQQQRLLGIRLLLSEHAAPVWRDCGHTNGIMMEHTSGLVAALSIRQPTTTNRRPPAEWLSETTTKLSPNGQKSE
jgi:hypothetical protein